LRIYIDKEKRVDFILKTNLLTPLFGLEVFSNEQTEFISKYGHWLKALVNGNLRKITSAREKFVDVINGKLNPKPRFQS
jgi:hypothetical protein